jgi:hypothetical protein
MLARGAWLLLLAYGKFSVERNKCLALTFLRLLLLPKLRTAVESFLVYSFSEAMNIRVRCVT